MARALYLSGGAEPRFTHRNVDFTGQAASQAANVLILSAGYTENLMRVDDVMEWPNLAE
jgi:hypothetical protein